MIKIKITKLYAVYGWRWNIDDEMCGICQQGFDFMCAECKHPSECPPQTGSCEHSFHQHCIEKWLESSGECPMCRLKWDCKKAYKFENK